MFSPRSCAAASGFTKLGTTHQIVKQYSSLSPYTWSGKKKLRVKDTVNLFKIDSEEILGYLQTT